ncbi:MAG: YebC/PmpR family DNA-binding transcriptional regulator, partial [Patescibacteria group bacterium]|nr:YebC/PmpR family DNA-binding transcriptional regulator [Patescibacteria group bacterium]
SRNRTSASIKHIFSTHGGNLAGSGAVQWMFEKKGVNRLSRGGALSQTASRVELPEDVEMALIDAGADDIAVEEEETIVTSPVEAVTKIRDAALKAGLPVAATDIEWVFKEQAPDLSEEVMNQVGELLEALDADDDVQSVYSAVGTV